MNQKDVDVYDIDVLEDSVEEKENESLELSQSLEESSESKSV